MRPRATFVANTSNRYYDWAVDHRDYHFAGRANGAQLLASFTNVFDGEMGDLTPERRVELDRRGHDPPPRLVLALGSPLQLVCPAGRHFA